MAYGTRLKVDPVREIDFSDVTGAYASVGSPLASHVRILAFNNAMDESLYISIDGSTNQFRIESNSFKLFDFSANKIRDDGLFLPVGTQIFVKNVGASVTSGTFWVESLFGEGGK